MENYNELEFVNISSQEELTIKSIAELIKEITNYQAEIRWDTSKPDGTPRKIMDNSRLNNMNWRPSIKLADGLQMVYNEISNNSSIIN